MPYSTPPVRVDTATQADDGVIHVTKREAEMLRRVVRELEGDQGDSDDSEWTPYGLCTVSTVQMSPQRTQRKRVFLDYDCVAAYSYNHDWNDIERSARPTHAAARLLHRARQWTDTSRWWSMRWPSDAVSLLGGACDLETQPRPRSQAALS